MTYWNHSTRPAAADTPKTWDEWTDVLGQTYRPGDCVAIAVINGRSPQMVIARVLQINRLNSKGEEHYEICSRWDRCEPGTPGGREDVRWDPDTRSHVGLGTWAIQETRPSCTVRCQPIEDARGFGRYGNKAVTYQFWQNIIRVDGAEFERLAAASIEDLQELAEELA